MDPKLCSNGCGFFGSSSTLDLCSKCFRQHLAAVAPALEARAESPAEAPEAPAVERSPEKDRCRMCERRVRVGRGFKCRCGFLFCESHRYPEEHLCMFDYRAMGKLEIARVNPTVKADKIQRI